MDQGQVGAKMEKVDFKSGQMAGKGLLAKPFHREMIRILQHSTTPHRTFSGPRVLLRDRNPMDSR
eukprot:1698479-Rhodomonas_salina.5